MDFIRVVPSASFLSVLEELHACPGAPKSIKRYFDWKKRNLGSSESGINIRIRSKDGNSPDPGQIKTDSEESTIVESHPQTEKDAKLDNSDVEETEVNDTADDSSNSLLLLTSDVKWCHTKMRERGMSQRIHQLLNDSEILFPKYEPTPRNPELEARIQKLKAEQENREYQRMTRSISQLKKGYATTIGNEYREMHKEMTRHLITGIQYLLSIVGTFYAIFMGVGLAIPDYAPRVVSGICAALVVAIAEIYFIIRDDIRFENEKKKSK